MMGARWLLVQSTCGRARGRPASAGAGVMNATEHPELPSASSRLSPSAGGPAVIPGRGWALVLERDEDTQASSGRDVVHDLFDAQGHALLFVDHVAHVEPHGQPLRQEELHAETEGAGQ